MEHLATVADPALAATHQVLAMGNQPLVKLAGEHRNAVHRHRLTDRWVTLQLVLELAIEEAAAGG